MKRMQQTRIKLTWFGAITFAVAIILSIIFKMEQVAVSAIGGITFIIGGYQASEGYTKGKYIQKSENLKNVKQ